MKRNVCYITLWADFFRHPKTLRLKRTIGQDAYWIPPRLWCYCVEKGNGSIGDLDDITLAEVLEYAGDPAAMRKALVDAGYLSEDGKTVVGWDDYYAALQQFRHERAKKAAGVRWSKDSPPASPSDHTRETEREGERVLVLEEKHSSSIEKHASSMLEASATPPHTQPPALSLEPTSPPKPTIAVEDIYNTYPRRQGRKDALKAIAKAIDDGADPKHLLESATAFAAATRRWNEYDRGNFIPMPATWFNRGSYDDDPKTWERSYANPHQVPAATAEDHAKHGWEMPP